MSAVNPTQVTGLIVDEFIRYAQAHLSTVSGVINTISLYQVGPVPTPLPGIITWSGYTVTPSQPSSQPTEDDFPAKENQSEDDKQKSALITNETENGVTEEQMDKEIRRKGFAEEEEDEVEEVKFSEGKPFVSGFRGGGGFTAGFSGAVTVDLGALDLSADWVTLSSKFVGKNEGFAQKATWDVNAYRLGFGSDKIIGADGKIRDVVVGDVTSVDAALKMLQYELSVSYKSRLVGTGATKISEATFNSLNNKQKAALISYVYNVGSLRPGIAEAIRNGNLASAAQQIQAGPVTADGQVLAGLVRRRAEEATLFSSA
jgi:GH24 family phage-related lysozyme (muramidase)